MPDRLRALALYGNAYPGLRRTLFDTVLGPAARGLAQTVPRLRSSHLFRRLTEGSPHYQRAYTSDWLDALRAEPSLALDECSVSNELSMRSYLRRVGDYDVVILLHSATGSNLDFLERASSALQSRRGALVTFIGNEFKLMSQKIAFLRTTAADVIATQLPIEAGRWLYAECTAASVVAAPHGLNPERFVPGPPSRPIDIGFRGDQYESRMLGDDDRERILTYFARLPPDAGLRVDVEFRRTFADEWAELLRSSAATVGAEAGTFFLERDDHTQDAVARYLADSPSATFAEVFDRFFRDYRGAVSGKAVSSRHFEAIGTKTAQILIEGRYNDILARDVHYIGVKSDLSDIGVALDRYRDQSHRQHMVDLTYDFVCSQHTYAHRVRHVLGHLRAR